jgi:hypothetical protein
MAEQRIWQYEVVGVGGSMEGRIEVGATILDKWVGRSHTYNIFNLPRAKATGWFEVKLIGEASEEQATQLRENWARARAERSAGSPA